MFTGVTMGTDYGYGTDPGYMTSSFESEANSSYEDGSICSEVMFYFSQTREELRRKLEQERRKRQEEEAKAKMEREKRVSQGPLICPFLFLIFFLNFMEHLTLVRLR